MIYQKVINTIIYLAIGTIMAIAIMAALGGDADKGILDLF